MAAEETVTEEETEETTTTEEVEETEAETAEETKPDYEALAKKHEGRAKHSFTKVKELEAKLKKLEDADKSEQDKALDKAREDAKTEVASAYQKRLLRAEVKALAAGKFADPEDAQDLLKLKDEDVFDEDGDVKTDVVETALKDLLERKPHLAAGGNSGAGDPDRGKGKGAASTLEEMSVEDHIKRQSST